MSKYKEFAIQVAKDAGNLLLEHYGKLQSLEYKLKTNFKTEVDDESDELIRKAIMKEFPNHNILSEEQDDKQNGSDYSWVVDPLDGTLPYTFGISDHFAVSIALVKGKSPILGVIYAPMRDELYTAEFNEGAFLNQSAIRVSSVEDINKAMIGMDYGKFFRDKIVDYQKKLLSENGITYPVSYGCASVSLGLVASGKLHGYLALKLEPWDMAAGVLINREAGAKVTTIDGKDWELGDESILVANPELHQKLYEFLNPSFSCLKIA